MNVDNNKNRTRGYLERVVGVVKEEPATFSSTTDIIK